LILSLYFICNHTPTTDIYPLSLHDALPILPAAAPAVPPDTGASRNARSTPLAASATLRALVGAMVLESITSVPFGSLRSRPVSRSEEHTSELQSQSNLVCRLLLEKKKKKKY